MKGVLSACLAVLLFSFVCNVFAQDICLATPPSRGPGASCSGVIQCELGFWCNNQSICTPYLTAGASCAFALNEQNGVNYQCGPSALCQGPSGNTVCVPYVGPGQNCNSQYQFTQTIPFCSPTLNCNSSTNTCWGGYVNDTCQLNTDCYSLSCNGKYCVGLPEQSVCSSTWQCAPGLFCQIPPGSPNGQGTCVPLLTSGTCNIGYDWTSQLGPQCAYGYVCDALSPSDTNQCYAINTRQAGAYCGIHSSLCQGSMRCQNGYCAKSSGTYCNGGGCAATQTCACGGQPLQNGYGTGNCVSSCQYSSQQALIQCIQQNCQTYTPFAAFMTDYAGSCISRLCSAQFKTFLACNSGSSLFVNVSLLLLSALFLVFTKF